MIKKYWLFTISCVLLSGCNTNPQTCDPTKPGFISGLSAMASGCYEQRVADRQNAALEGQASTSELTTENRYLKTEKQKTSASKNQYQSKVASIERKNQSIKSAASSASNSSAAQKAEEQASDVAAALIVE